jgi:hypothetical protein
MFEIVHYLYNLWMLTSFRTGCRSCWPYCSDDRIDGVARTASYLLCRWKGWSSSGVHCESCSERRTHDFCQWQIENTNILEKWDITILWNTIRAPSSSCTKTITRHVDKDLLRLEHIIQNRQTVIQHYVIVDAAALARPDTVSWRRKVVVWIRD